MAVAGSIAAPAAVQADVYASARVGIWNVDDGNVSDLELRSFSSRFGAKGETDLGNGMTAYGRYEWDVDLNDESNSEDLSVRHRYVGLKGDFGDVRMGQGSQTFYNHTIAPWDLPWWHVGYAVINYSNRTDNALTYMGMAGNVSFGITAYFTNDDLDEDAPDGLEVGATFPIGDLALGVGLKTTAGSDADVGATAASNTEAGSIGVSPEDDDIIGVTLSGINLGDSVSLVVGLQLQDISVSGGSDGDATAIIIGAGFGNAYLNFETTNVDVGSIDIDPTAITLGYTQNLGRNTTMYYEYWNLDPDVSGLDDQTHLMAVLKYDIL